jgi:predicted AlkP superfamily phosphohydrolase/phosphomutase
VGQPVVVIGLDAADPLLLERWLAAGRLPNLQRLRASGAYARLTTFDMCRAEACNTTFLTGCPPSRHGFWSPFRFSPATYDVDQAPHEFHDYPPFYALGDDYRVAVFDMPQTTLSNRVNGVQVLAWGAHSPWTPSVSRPEGLFDEIVSRFGVHPTLRKDDVTSMADAAAMRQLKDGLSVGIERRVAVCRDLLARERWDLFLTYFGELHSGQHYFWHLSQPEHPLHATLATAGVDPLLELFQQVDAAIPRIVDAAPPDARIVVFSDHGMESNSTDVPSTVLLPELLYRLAFPGRYGLAMGKLGAPPPPLVQPRSNRSWRSMLYDLKEDANPVTRWLRRRLPTDTFHYAIERRLGLDALPLCPDDCKLGAQPPMWYHPAWPAMKAFALPSFSEGYVRINVRGREGAGWVEPADYQSACDDVERELRLLRNPRTGQPAVSRVVRTRRDPFQASSPDDRPSDADLIVLWDSSPTDVVDSPTVGRIGPVPFKRSGSHVNRGFLIATGAGIPAGVTLREHHALDLAPTILDLMGAPIPDHAEGVAMFGHLRRRVDLAG